MSDRKKVIHVKDLVIKADNVHVESAQPQRRRDPFFGGPRPRFNPVQEENREQEHEEEEAHESAAEAESTDENDERDDRDDRRPFSWI